MSDMNDRDVHASPPLTYFCPKKLDERFQRLLANLTQVTGAEITSAIDELQGPRGPKLDSKGGPSPC